MTSSSSSSALALESSWNNHFGRLLSERVELSGNGGRCKLQDAIQHYEGSTAAAGIMFSVTAKQNLEILSFEFSDLPTNEDLEVEIYTRTGGDYINFVDKPDDWTLFGESTAVPDPEGVGAIVPRGDMVLPSIVMASSETRSFYLTLKTQHLQVDDKQGTSGMPYVSDDFLDVNVGVSLRRYSFDPQVDQNRAFQGKIHYKSVQACTNFGIPTEVVIPWVVRPTATNRDVNEIFTDGIKEVMDNNPKLRVMVNSHGLSLDGVRSVQQEELDDCTEYGFANGCLLYNGVLNYRHYQSLTSKELTFQLMNDFFSKGSLNFPIYDYELIYAGDPVHRRVYDIFLKGVPDGVILNPLQRSYIEDVTFEFLESFSEAETSIVTVIGQNIDDNEDDAEERRRYLRGRDLQRTGVISVAAGIAGVAPDAKEYFQAIEATFSRQGSVYRDFLVKQQYRPSQINDRGTNFGDIFSELFAVSVVRSLTNNTDFDDDDFVGLEDEGGLWSDQFKIIIFSSVLALSFCCLAYRISVDCLCVSKDDQIKTKKLKNNQAKEEAKQAGKIPDKEREELLNKMDLYPTPKPAPEQAKPAPRGRSVSPTRGVKKSSTFSGVDGFLGSSAPSKPAARGRSRSPTAATNRGRSRSPASRANRGRSRSPGAAANRGRSRSPARDAANTMSFRVPSKSSQHDRTSKSGSLHERTSFSHPEPTRGVAKSSTFSGYDGFLKSAGSKPEPQRGVRASTSGGLSAMVHGRPEPSSRGIGISRSFSGIDGLKSTIGGGGQQQQLQIAKPKRPSWASQDARPENVTSLALVPRPPPPSGTPPGKKKKKKKKKNGDDSTRSARSTMSSQSARSKSSTGSGPGGPRKPPPGKGKGKRPGPPRKRTSAESGGGGGFAPGSPQPYSNSSSGKRAVPPPTRVGMIGPLA